MKNETKTRDEEVVEARTSKERVTKKQVKDDLIQVAGALFGAAFAGFSEPVKKN